MRWDDAEASSPLLRACRKNKSDVRAAVTKHLCFFLVNKELHEKITATKVSTYMLAEGCMMLVNFSSSPPMTLANCCTIPTIPCVALIKRLVGWSDGLSRSAKGS